MAHQVLGLNLTVAVAMPSPTDLRPLGPLPPKAIYPTPEALFAALQSHARDNGYAISKDSTSTVRRVYICSKGGRYNPKGKDPNTHTSKRYKDTSSTKTSCLFQIYRRHT